MLRTDYFHIFQLLLYILNLSIILAKQIDIKQFIINTYLSNNLNITRSWYSHIPA